MATYQTLKPWRYNPTAVPGSWQKFIVGDTFDYPSLIFPTALPIAWLISDGAVKEVIAP